MPIWGEPQVWLNGSNWSGSTYLTSITTSDNTISPYYYAQQNPVISPVLESPSAKLGDREWLEAQIAEVCELAVAA